MKVEMRELDSIKPYAKNAKKHDQTQIDNVAESIRQYGFVQPIVVDRDGVIVIGHCRALGAKNLGLKEVPCVCVDDLTPEQVNALRIVDNKSNESDWDLDLLEQELPELDLGAFIFDFGLKSEKKAADEQPEVPFSEILGEESNYLILQFKTDVAWLQAQTLFDIGPVSVPIISVNGGKKKEIKRQGTGRVLDGEVAIEKLLGEQK